MKTYPTIKSSAKAQCLFAVAAASVMAAFSANAQISVDLTSVSSNPEFTDYNFIISGNTPGNAEYTPYGVIFEMSGFDSSMPVAGGLSGAGDGIPSDPPMYSDSSITVSQYFTGGYFDNTFSVTSFGTVIVPSLSWNFDEIGVSLPYETSIYSDSGTVVVPEPTRTGFAFGAVAFAALAVPAWWRRRGAN
jgi:hypothetical protein